MDTLSVTIQTHTHYHKGQRCHKGQMIKVDKLTAQFLLRAGVIRKLPASLKPSSIKESSHD